MISRNAIHRFFSFLSLLLMCACSPAGEIWRLFEESISIADAVEGDAFLLANDIVLSGTFEQDVWAAGRKIDLSGTVRDDVRLAGLEVVHLNGTVKGNARLLSSLGNVVLATNSVVEAGAVLQAGKRISINGRVLGDVWVQAPRVVVQGEIDGDLSVNSRNIQLLPGTIIRGNLISIGSQPVPVPRGVTVIGERLQVSEGPSELSRQLQQIGWMIKGLQFITAILLGLGMLRFFPRFTGQNVDLLLNRQGPLVTIGLLWLIGMTLMGYFLLFSVIGSGVGLFLLVITALMFLLGKIFVAYLIGMLLLRQTTDLAFGKLSLALILGMAVLYTAYSIPYIGGSIYILSSCWGMGAMLVNLRSSQKPLQFLAPISKQDQPT